MYVCPESIDAIRGCLGTIFTAIDCVCPSDPAQRLYDNAFASVRPPGHHATHRIPMGFCFINNVVVGSIYAYRQYNVHRIAIIDFDLHHGNGTQELIKRINSERIGSLENKELKIFYGSLHDILSYPCEDGNESAVEAASLCLMNHGQYIWNIHLEEYRQEAEFWQDYNDYYRSLLTQARRFFKGYPPRNCMIFVSAGFDAHEYEHKYMQRHQRRVVNGFYHRFTEEMVVLADQCCDGRIVSVLEGGYSDAALAHGATGHIGALLGLPSKQCLLPLTPLHVRNSTRKAASNLAKSVISQTSGAGEMASRTSTKLVHPSVTNLNLVVSPLTVREADPLGSQLDLLTGTVPLLKGNSPVLGKEEK